jgi:hypothetical protein
MIDLDLTVDFDREGGFERPEIETEISRKEKKAFDVDIFKQT